MANRNTNRRQALEKEVKDLYAQFSPGEDAIAAEAVLDLTTDITLTSAAAGAARNTTTFELVVEAAAANPTDTVLVDFSGDADAIVCTVTPNDGTNNAATPVDLDEDELAELINTGAVAGKTITLTDGDDLRELQTASGGAADALTSADDQEAEFADGVDTVEPELITAYGFASIARNGAGDWTLTLQDKYVRISNAKAIYKRSTAEDLQFQLHTDSVASAATLRVLALTGATPTQPDPAGVIVLKVELRNSSV